MKKFKCWLSETVCWTIASILLTMVICALFFVGFVVSNLFKFGL